MYKWFQTVFLNCKSHIIYVQDQQQKHPFSDIYVVLEMEKRTGKKPREVIGWKRQRQEAIRQREGEEGQERSMFFNLYDMLTDYYITFVTKFVSICLKKRKREKKKSNRVRRNLQYIHGQLSLFSGCTHSVQLLSYWSNLLTREMSNKSWSHCVLVKHSSSSSSSSSDSSSSSSSESEDEVNRDRIQDQRPCVTQTKTFLQ